MSEVYFSMGRPLQLGYGQEAVIRGEPQRWFLPTRCMIPSRCIGWDVIGWQVGGEALLLGSLPAEVFSEVSLWPEIGWPVLGPGRPAIVTVRAPPRPRRVHWSQWRERSSSLRHGLWLKPSKARPVLRVRRRLWFYCAGRPWWVPPPLPVAFSMAFYGRQVPVPMRRK